MRPAYPPALVVAAALVAIGVAGCGGNSGRAAADAIAITATDKTCEVAKKSLPAGTNSFAITNKGSTVTEVYVYAPGDKIVTEREDIAPGTKATLVAELKAGKYQV